MKYFCDFYSILTKIRNFEIYEKKSSQSRDQIINNLLTELILSSRVKNLMFINAVTWRIGENRKYVY